MSTDDEQAEETAGSLVPVEQDSVPFYGRELVAVVLSDGRICAVLRWLCDGLSLNVQSQLRTIRGRTALADGLVMVRVDTEGGAQTMPALTLDALPGWLFAVDERRVKPEARADVVLFQRECARALADYFAHKRSGTVSTRTAVMPADLHLSTQITQIAEQIDTLTGVVTFLQEHMAGLLALPDHVAGLAGQLGQALTLLESLAARQDAADTRIARLDERTKHLTPAHARTVQELVDRLVRETKHLPAPLSYAIVYGRLKHRFRASSYREIADERFDEVMAFLRDELHRATRGEAPEQGALF